SPRLASPAPAQHHCGPAETRPNSSFIKRRRMDGWMDALVCLVCLVGERGCLASQWEGRHSASFYASPCLQGVDIVRAVANRGEGGFVWNCLYRFLDAVRGSHVRVVVCTSSPWHVACTK